MQKSPAQLHSQHNTLGSTQTRRPRRSLASMACTKGAAAPPFCPLKLSSIPATNLLGPAALGLSLSLCVLSNPSGILPG